MADITSDMINEIVNKLPSATNDQLRAIYNIINKTNDLSVNNDNFIDMTLNRPTPIEHSEIKGLYYVKDALTIHEEELFIKYMESDEFSSYLKPIASSNTKVKKESRLVAYFGYNYNVQQVKVDKTSAPPIPHQIDELGHLALKILPRPPRSDGTPWEYNMVVLNRYIGANKQGIGAHIDADGFGHTVISYTFNSGTTMRFTRPDHKPVDVYVEPRSLYIMTGEARSKWKHEMPGRMSDTVDGKKVLRGVRYSITFRMVDPEWKK